MIFIFIMIIGNLFLLNGLFGGTVFGDLAGNGMVWFFVIGAIAADIYCIYLIVRNVSDNRKQQRIAAENNRIAEVTRKVEALINKYTMMSLTANRSPVPFQIEPEFINKEVVLAVTSYKERMATIYKRYSAIINEIEQILACTDCLSVDDKYSHLTSNEAKLRQLKEEGDACLSHISSCKIEMLNEDRYRLFEIKHAFNYLRKSKKCRSNSSTINEFITPDKPSDLMLFRFKNEPVILFWEYNYFCLFGNVILVFDKNGVFATAIDPSALKIMVERETTSVTVCNGNARLNQYIADDSKCVSQGLTRLTWLHTCRDGSPDRRYSYNPMLEHRTDTYEYVVIDISIANKKASFIASSGAAGDAFEKVTQNYSRKCNHRHNPTPELLALIKKLSDEQNAQIESIIRKYKAATDTNGYFCRLIES